jgi:tetratricopeptide (TPR) repeat protein
VIPRPARPRIFVLISLLLLLGGGSWLVWKKRSRAWRPATPELTTPKFALALLPADQPVFFNAAARKWLEDQKPACVPTPAKDPESDFSRRQNRAVQEPALFRELDREVRFATVWLLGEPSWFKPLLDHLLETKDFTISYVDHSSILFTRGQKEGFEMPDPVRAAEQFQDARERAFYLANAGSRLALLRRGDAAARCLRAAEESSSSLPDVWAGWSTYRMTKGEWNNALMAADRALALDPEFIAGLACKVQTLFAMKRFKEAYKLSEQLLAASPEDPATLFYHAKLSHEARAFDAEIDALQRLIALGEKAGINVSSYRIYLAQALAHRGDGDEARNQLTLSLLDTSLPREQRKQADDLLGHIQEQMKKLN